MVFNKVPEALSSTEASDITAYFADMFAQSLSEPDSVMFEAVRKIGENKDPAERYSAYQAYWDRLAPDAQLGSLKLWHQWSDLVRLSHEVAQRNGINLRNNPGQSLKAAIAASNLNEEELDKITKEVHWYTQTTAHPTHLTARVYDAARMDLRNSLGRHVIKSNPTSWKNVEENFESFSQNRDVIRLEKRTAREEAEEAFDFVENILWGSAIASREYLRRRNLRLTPQNIADHMIALAGGWEMGDADGNPARTAAMMAEALANEPLLVVRSVIRRLTEWQNETGNKKPLQNLIDHLTQKSKENNPVSAESILEALNKLDYMGEEGIYSNLTLLRSVLTKCGLHWRCGDIRQSSEIHAQIWP
jgi:phosphoenolpyruvate carboxylase